jgi:hypothetical protein
MRSVTTFPANEFGLVPAVGFHRIPASRAGDARPSRIDQRNHPTLKSGLVFDKAWQPAEGPGGVSGPLISPNRNSRTNARNVFQGESASGVFGGVNDLFRNTVVLILAKAGFAPRQLAKFLLRSLGFEPLETAAQAMVLLPDLLDRCARVRLAIAGGGLNIQPPCQ